MAVALLAGGLLSASSAQAIYPGTNGRIAYIAPGQGIASDEVFTVLPDGSDVRQLTNDEYSYAWLSWSADGRRLLITRDAFQGRWQLATLDAKGGTPAIVLRSEKSLGPASFSPSGHRLVYTNGRAIRIASVGGEVLKRVVMAAPGRSVASPEYFPTGKVIVFAGQPAGGAGSGIWRVARDGASLRRLTSSARDNFPHWSPDGRHIVFQRSPPDAEKCCNQIIVMRANGARRHPVSYPASEASGPTYAPDGTRIALSLYSGGGLFGPICSDIYTMSTAGTDVQRVTSGCDPSGTCDLAHSPSWQPIR